MNEYSVPDFAVEEMRVIRAAPVVQKPEPRHVKSDITSNYKEVGRWL